MRRREDVKMRRCEDEKMLDRPPLLEKPCAQTLSGKMCRDSDRSHPPIAQRKPRTMSEHLVYDVNFE